MSEGVVVGVDIGGTKVLAGVVDDDGAVASTALRTTPGRRGVTRQAEDAMVEAVLEAAGGRARSPGWASPRPASSTRAASG